MPELGSIICAHLIDRAKEGDQDAARELAGYVSLYLSGEAPGPMPEAVRAYLCLGFDAIAQGESADKALLLRKRKGRQRADSLPIATEVHYSHLPMHKEPGGAYYEIGRQFNKSPSAIEAAYSQWREGFRINDEIDRDEGPPWPVPYPKKIGEFLGYTPNSH